MVSIPLHGVALIGKLSSRSKPHKGKTTAVYSERGYARHEKEAPTTLRPTDSHTSQRLKIRGFAGHYEHLADKVVCISSFLRRAE